MTYKYNTVDVFKVSLLSGLYFGVFSGIINLSFINGIFGAFSFTVGFGIFLNIYLANKTKKSKILKDDILKYRKVICDGPASYATSGGWLFLSEDALEFYADKFNFVKKNIPILLNEIQNVETKHFNKLIITTNKEQYTFVVQKSKLWEQSISEVI